MKTGKRKILGKIKCYTVLLIVIFFVMAVTAYCCANDVNVVKTEEQFLSPSFRHVFGTDLFGRDVFLRTIRGFMNAFILGFVSWLISFGAGIFLGVVVAYYGGIPDEIFFFVSNLVFSIPTLLMALCFAAISSSRILALLFLISSAAIFHNAKIVRSQIQGFVKQNFLIELRLLGAGFWHILKHHLLREAVLQLLPIMPLMIGHIILSISTFSFLGYGIRAPEAEIGLILSENFKYVTTAPWASLLPGCFQFIMIFILSRYGETIRKYYVKGARLDVT